MANFTPGNNENIYQLLSQHNFTFINQKIDDYKCIICHRILINAHQAFCGCNYCEKCVDEQVRCGVLFCPGDTGECKTAKLSNIFPDQKTNKQILQLVVKCPEEMCCYESQLRNMGDHLRLCGKRILECPFTDFGCDQGKLKRDELNEHLQQESYRHIKKLVDVIGNLRNELAELKRDLEKYDDAIDNLVKSDREKAVIIDSLRDEIESIKLDAVLEQRVDNLGSILDDKADRTVLEQRVDNLESILDGKADQPVLEQRVDNLGNILDGKVDKIVAEMETKLEEMRLEWRGAMEQQEWALANVEEINEVKYQTEIAETIDSLAKYLPEKTDADFVWTIDNIAEKRQKRLNIHSAYFNGRAEPYNMQLCCYIGGSDFKVYIRIYPSNSDESLHWPFERNVTIAITNENRLKAREYIMQHCTIAKPSKFRRSSDPFEFNLNELSIEGLLNDNRLTVQCFIRNG